MMEWDEVKKLNFKRVDLCRSQPAIKKIGGTEYLLVACVNIDEGFQEKLRKFDAFACGAREQGLFVRTIKTAGASCATMALYVRPRDLSDQCALNFIIETINTI